ncbi:MAG TPA: HRDC domain-containing protein [Gemmatimonadaceae bacterium]|nr:HRDC domain-containing protein [Gemmatimonadaceae bacterium]
MRHQAIYLDTAQDTSRFLRSIAGVDQLAIDTEGASFHRFIDRIYLLQLSTRDSSAIIDPLPIGVPAELGTLLEDPKVEIVFHDADYDLRLLRQDYGWQVRNIFDTRVAAQLLGIRAFGLAALLEKYFGVKLDKKHQRADWSMRPLTPDMLEYAAQDTMHLLGLRDRLADELKRIARWEWAREEFARLESTGWDVEDEATAFLRMKGARDLNRRELAVLRELVIWRNEVARRADRATFRVVGNEPLLEIARGRPSTREALGAIKGMPRSLLERAAADILQAVKRGVDLPDSDLPRFPKAVRWERDPEFDVRVSAVRTVRDAAAARLDMDPGVLCSRDRLEAVARRNPATLDEMSEIAELRRWQVKVLGPEFLSALAPHRKAVAQRPM